MTKRDARRLVLAVVALATAAAAHGLAQGQQPQNVSIPEPGVPQTMTIEGAFIRAAYNSEGYVIIGFRLANASVGEPWMLLDVGMTLRGTAPNYKLTRRTVWLDTPDGRQIPMPSNEEFQKANLSALERRSQFTYDSIDYFPPLATEPCWIGRSWDGAELSSTRGCLGKHFFPIPGGIKHGQYWLNVKFEKSLIRVPFRIMTKDEEQVLNKNFKSIQKQVEEAFAPQKKK